MQGQNLGICEDLLCFRLEILVGCIHFSEDINKIRVMDEEIRIVLFNTKCIYVLKHYIL